MSNEPNGFAKYLVIFVDILEAKIELIFKRHIKLTKFFMKSLKETSKMI